MKMLLNLFLLLFMGTAFAQSIPSKEVQIKSAVLAAPEMYRDHATVIGYDTQGKFTTLRQGNNGMVCLADDPHQKGISISCYSDKLEPFMKRGRELTAEGKSTAEKRAIRKKEIEQGTLPLPKEPAATYVLSAKDSDFDPQTGNLKNSSLRYVFYKPYMTVEETGLPDKPQGPGMPWLMDAGTHRSHIMITPQ